MIGVIVPLTGVSAVVFVVWAICAIYHGSSNSTGSLDEDCYREFHWRLSQFTEAQIYAADKDGSFERLWSELVSRYGQDVAFRTCVRVDRELS